MKKNLVASLGLIGLMLSAASILASCSHEHIFSEDWKSNDTHHYHECACGEKEGEALHTYSEGIVSLDPSNDTPGTKKFTCTVCGHEKSDSYIAAPSKPLNFSGVASNAQVVLTWSQPSNNGGAPITKYEVHDGNNWISSQKELTYTFTELINNQEYTFKVRAFNSVGAGEESEPLVLKPLADVVAPSVVQNLKATPSNKQVLLSWQAPLSDGNRPITKYEVKIDDSNWEDAGTNLSYTATGLTNSKEYTFYVRAYNGYFLSEEVSIKERPADVPDAPFLNKATKKVNNSIELSWVDPSSDGGSPIITYETQINDEYWMIPTLYNAVIYDGLVPGNEYTVRVRAVNRIGNSANLEYSFTYYAVPSVIQNLVVTPRMGGFELEWDPPTNSAISNPLYEVRVDNVMVQKNLAETSAQITGLTNGQEYAISVLCLSDFPNVNSDAITINSKPGGAPGKVVVFQTDSRVANTVKISWDAAADNGYEITDYEISLNGDPYFSVGNVLTYTKSEMGRGNYTFMVRAVNALGKGPDSIQPTFTIFDLQGAVLNLACRIGGDDFVLTWEPPANASTTYSSLTYIVTVDNLNEYNAGTNLTYSVPDLEIGVDHTFSVRAEFLTNVGPESSISGTFISLPGAPASFSHTAFPSTVRLNWAEPSIDGGLAINDYKVQQDDGEWIAVGGSAREYTFNGVVPHVEHTFRIRAVNGWGDGEIASLKATVTEKAGKVQNLQASENEVGIVTVSFSPPANAATADFDEYLYMYSDGDTSSGWRTVPEGEFSFIISDLIPGVVYQITVAAALNRVLAETHFVLIAI